MILDNFEEHYKQKLDYKVLGPKGYELVLDFYFVDYLSGIYIMHRILNSPIDLFNIFNKFILRSKRSPVPFV